MKLTMASFVVLLVALGLLPGCSSPGPVSAARVSAEPPARDAVVIVNGVPITRAELAVATPSASPHGRGASEEPAAVLEHLIDQELLAQRAIELGLDRDARYREELAVMQSQLDAWKRSHLAELAAAHAEGAAEPTETEARRYFADHEAHIRTEVRVEQILTRDEARLRPVAEALAAGRPFGEVAAEQMPGLPPGQRPWDLGYLKWSEVPEAWQPVLDGLAVGEISRIIRGPNHRFWIIRLVDRRRSDEMTYAVARPVILEQLRAERAATARTHRRQELRSAARIVYPRSPE